MHARCAHHAAAIGVMLVDPLQQACIVPRTLAWGPRDPVVEATGRDLQTTAHEPDRVLAAVTSDRLVPQDDALAKNVAASRKKSRSLVIRANSSTAG